MNPERLRAYVNLIEKLMSCPSGEEWILLRQHETLVNPELVQVMEQVAAQLVNQGNLKEAKFLHNLASQIHHLFVAQTARPPEQDQNTQAYLNLIKALLECPEGVEGELLAAHPELIDPGLVHAMQQLAAQMAANGNQDTAQYLQHWATELNRLWLQQHEFQPTFQKDPEPKHLNPSVATSIPQPPVPLSQSVSDGRLTPSPPEEIEDFWTEPEPAGEPAQRPLSLQTRPRQPPAVFTQPTPVETLAPLSRSDSAAYNQINHYLDAIAGALTHLSETLTPAAQPPADPLWYMDILERACTGQWILTSAEIHKLIGVHPSCPKDRQSFQRGSWVFVKAGKVGAQTGWRVTKE